MLRFKSAQTPQFADVNVRRAFGHARDILLNQKNDETAQHILAAEEELMASNPHLSIQELSSLPIGDTLKKILGETNWVFRPNEGILGQ